MTELVELETMGPNLEDIFQRIWINRQFQQRKKDVLSTTQKESQGWSGSLSTAALGPVLNEGNIIRKEINGHV